MLICSVNNIVTSRVSGQKLEVTPTWFRPCFASRSKVFSKFPGVLMLLALISLSHLASANETGGTLSLAWDRSPSTDVVGYRVYFGPASRRYTNSVYVGNATSNVVRGLTAGVPYYFAMTAVDATGLESDYSPELAHTPAIGGPQVKMTLASNRQVILRVNGSTGQVYDFLTTTNLTAWSFLGRASVASDGQAICIDYEAPSHRSRYYKALLR